MPIKINPGHYSRAIVVDLPDENTGRVRVRVPEFHGPCLSGSVSGFPERYRVEDKDLPLADVCCPLGSTASAIAVNEIVYVTFPDCKLDMPLIVGTTGSFMEESYTGKSTDYSEGYVISNDLVDESGQSSEGIVWTGGTGSGSTMVSRAVSLLGSNYKNPCTWYGINSHWCAMFVSYVAHLLGYIGSDAQKGFSDNRAFGTNGIIPLHAYCPYGAQAFALRGQWAKSSSGYTPRPGDIVYFNWSGNTSLDYLDHVAIVEKVASGQVYTIGGNENGSKGSWVDSNGVVHQSYYWDNSKVCRTSYSISSKCIIGYGTPKYPTVVKKVSSPDGESTDR